MHYRLFGKTELQMPVFSCGGMRYQHKWDDCPLAHVPKAGQENLERTIHRALELGINHIETARGYGSSEMQLGLVLPKLPRDQMIVQTKVAPDDGPAKFLEEFETSMAYLNLEHVDLLGIHGINNPALLKETLRPGGVLDMARRIQKEGRARHIGFSTHGSKELVLEAVSSGAFDYVNLHWYFVYDTHWQAIEEATRQDMGVFIISPNDKGGRLYAPSDRLREHCQPLHPMQFNDLYCLARPQVHTLSIGASKPEDFEIHIDALQHLDTAAETIAPIERRIRDAMANALGADWMARWSQGLPEWENVPEGIHLREILRLWNFAKGMDMIEYSKARYNLLGNASHWFEGSSVRPYDQAAMTKALAQSPFADQIPHILWEADKLLRDEAVKRLSESD